VYFIVFYCNLVFLEGLRSLDFLKDMSKGMVIIVPGAGIHKLDQC